MSYDFDLMHPGCEHCGREPSTVHSWHGMTSNLAPMWRAAGLDPRDMRNKRAREVAPLLRAAVEKMEADPEAFRALNPSNGWGSYDGMMPLMRELLAAMERHPETTVGVWW